MPREILIIIIQKWQMVFLFDKVVYILLLYFRCKIFTFNQGWNENLNYIIYIDFELEEYNMGNVINSDNLVFDGAAYFTR